MSVGKMEVRATKSQSIDFGLSRHLLLGPEVSGLSGEESKPLGWSL